VGTTKGPARRLSHRGQRTSGKKARLCCAWSPSAERLRRFRVRGIAASSRGGATRADAFEDVTTQRQRDARRAARSGEQGHRRLLRRRGRGDHESNTRPRRLPAVDASPGASPPNEQAIAQERLDPQEGVADRPEARGLASVPRGTLQQCVEDVRLRSMTNTRPRRLLAVDASPARPTRRMSRPSRSWSADPARGGHVHLRQAGPVPRAAPQGGAQHHQQGRGRVARPRGHERGADGAANAVWRFRYGSTRPAVGVADEHGR
jgi:hypothetical protein